MEYNEDLKQYTYENDGLIFAWDEEPDGDIGSLIDLLSRNYRSHIESIIEFMMPDLELMYEAVDVETIKEKLGRPIIDYNNGKVTFLEQSFDDVHIFEFEFFDDEFEDLQYFSVDG